MAPHAELVGPFPDGVQPIEFDQLRRRVLWSMPSGLYLLASRAGSRRNLMTVSFVSQLATSPKALGVGVERGALTNELIREGGVFGLVLLTREQRSLIRHFVKPAAHDEAGATLAGEAYEDSRVTGVPVPHFAAAALDCRVLEEHALGSHDLFVGEVVDVLVRDESVLEQPLRMEDTRMSYGG